MIEPIKSPHADSLLVLTIGGGVNSTAEVVEMHRRGIMPDLLIFADTGGERPATYLAVKALSEWCVARGMPAIVTVKYHSKMHGARNLEEQCLADKTLPSIAFGFKQCSLKYKTEPVDKYISAWKGDAEVIKAIGFDAGEERRAKPFAGNWYPLIEWGLYRDDCIEICKSEGLPTAKSSCFFCPSMKKQEIFALKKEHPDLAARALAMEAQAELTTVKGLGRNYAWRDLLKNDENQLKLFSDSGAQEIPCGCYDG